MAVSFKHISSLLKIPVFLLCIVLGVEELQAFECLTEFYTYGKMVQIFQLQPDTGKKNNLQYPFKDESWDPFNENTNPLYGSNPSNVKSELIYNPQTGLYEFSQKMGERDFRRPVFMTFEEYIQYKNNKLQKDNWKNRVETELKAERKPLIPAIKVNNDIFDRIFGGNTIEIRPQGSAEVILGFQSNKIDNPAIPVRQRRQTNFLFDQNIQLNMFAKIGTKVQIPINFNTRAMFDFENQVKLDYTGDEDEIIKKIEAGNIAFPNSGTLITGSQTLFGLKTTMQFGKVTVTAVASQQRGEKKEIEVTNGSQLTKFEVRADNYEDNRHYFLGQYFYNNFDRGMSSLPFINSTVNITRLEVWITNINNAQTQNTRNVVAFQDLGESEYYDQTGFVGPPQAGTPGLPPTNDINPLYNKVKDESDIRGYFNANSYLNSNSQLQIARDYDVIEQARLLNPSEYTFNPQLGFISLNQRLNPDQVLAVAYQFTVGGSSEIYQVGEFSTDGIAGEKALILKLIKSTNINTSIPLWDLMMKNVYSLGAFNVSPEKFMMQVLYSSVDQGIDINFVPAGNINGRVLLQVMGLDKLNVQNDPGADGFFDFLEGRTIFASNGRVIFPSVEPFGKYLREKITGGNPSLDEEANKYVFQPLYDTTKIAAQQRPDLNRFKIKGQFSSKSGSEIMLNAMNIPQGSVTVTAGGAPLVENQDYTVDYMLGRVKIINSGLLESNKPIKVSLETNQLFGIQQKTLFGTHINYRVNKDFNVGMTAMRLRERPLTQKVNIGNEPMSNTIWGFNSDYKTDAPFLTKLIDKLPFFSTKEKSTLTVGGEFAHLIPDNNRAIGETGTAYIDDFEGSQSTIDIRNAFQWFMSGTPQNQPELFPEGNLSNNLAFAFNRAKLAWYTVDPLFYRNDGLTPEHLKDDQKQSNHYIREVLETELFPNRQPPAGQVLNMPVLDLAYFPNERGPYNYDTKPSLFSKGVDASGFLNNPETRWGGIMRRIETQDFQSTNIEYIQFWLMDPFHPDNGIDQPGQKVHDGGDLYFNLGNISEDVLRDDRKSFEQGVPKDGDLTKVIETAWGRMPKIQAIVNTFDNENSADRTTQDIGLDGLNDDAERTFFDTAYIQKIAQLWGTNSAAYQKATADPSSDNYRFYRGSQYDSEEKGIVDRYKDFNNMQGNSTTTETSPEPYPTAATTVPNVEDINRDNTLSVNESYFQYKVSIKPQDMVVGKNFIVDKVRGAGKLKNGETVDVDWYQFKIPISKPQKTVGGIADFNAIRFMRMFVHNFKQPVVLRFGRLEFMRGDWRRYEFDLRQPGEYVIDDGSDRTQFDISAVNIEENGQKVPVNYVIPPTINQQVDAGSINQRRLNEQSMVFKICNLADGDAKAAYRNINLDMLMYKKLRMFTHVESSGNQILNNGDLKLFIRLGRDYVDNYYEYEIPLVVTPEGFYSNNSEADRMKVWPLENDVIMDLDELQDIKRERNGRINAGLVNANLVYSKKAGAATISIRGYPNLAEVNTIMIGVRNPKATNGNDDGLAKCAEVWVNELRLTDFDKRSGWAATARVAAQLADLGNVTLAGSMSTPGFGSIEKRISERQRETIRMYDLATNIELGKLIPKSARLSIPFFYSISERMADPQFNPNDPDVELKELYKELRSEGRRNLIDSIKNITQDYTKRRSINFTNVRRTRGGSSGKPMPWDIENFAVSYSYNEEMRQDINTEFNNTRIHRGNLTYNYQLSPKNYQPLKNVKFLSNKWLALIKDINFTLLPKQITVSLSGERFFNEMKFRNNTDFPVPINPTYNKNFVMTRQYDLRWDFTKNINFDFNATNRTRFIEPNGKLETREKRDSLWREFFKGGINTNYQHQSNLNWNVPLNKIPVFDWITVKYRYSSGFDWTRAPLSADSLGATIRNNNTNQWTGQLNFTSFFNKSPYLKKVGQKIAGTYKPPKKQPPASKAPTIDPKTGKPIAAADSTKKKKEKDDSAITMQDRLAGLLLSFKNASITYTKSGSSIMPGFNDSNYVVGFNREFGAPGLNFLAGIQDPNFVIKAAENGWLVRQSILNIPFATTKSQQLQARLNLEPIRDFKIELTAQRNESFNSSFIYRWNETLGTYQRESPIETGNFNISINTFRTAFRDKPSESTSEIFQTFLDNRKIFSQRLGQKNPYSGIVDTSGYMTGYGAISQDVVIPAFLSAYTGKDPNTFSMSARPKIPMPNWRITYNGLSKFKFLAKYFKTVTLSHGFTSTYSISSFTNNLRFKEEDNGFTRETDQTGNFVPKLQILTISIIEQFSPLINIDMTLNNSLLAKVELKRDRNLSYNFTDNRLQETSGNEVIVGSGYKLKNVRFPFAVGNKKINNDLNLRADLSIRFTRTVARGAVDGINQITNGQRIVSLNTSADYMVTQRVNVRFFFDTIITRPLISTSFPSSNLKGGLSIRFTLS